MGEVTNLASGGGGWFAEQLSTYFRADGSMLLRQTYVLIGSEGIGYRWNP